MKKDIENPKDYIVKRSRELFVQGFHCSQAVFMATAEVFGFDENEIIPVIRSLAPFGGGMGSTGNVCGTLSGAIAVFGFIWGKTRPQDRDQRPMWKFSYKMVKKFEKITAQYGGIECKKIVNINWSSRDEIKAFRSGADGKRNRCLDVIEKTCGVLFELLDKELSK